jgi:class II lanthipeptide synthase
MLRVTADLRAIVEAVEIQAAGRFSILGETFEVPSGNGGISAMSSPLANALYHRMYCRPERGRSALAGDTRARRVFVEDLSRANCGTGTWEAGWIIEAVEDDGTLAVHKQGEDLTLWARPEQFRPMNGHIEIGSVGRLQLGKELREMLLGYYTVLGDTDKSTDEAGPSVDIVRFYWHLTAEIAPLWIHELTRHFNGARVPFHAKVQSDPIAYFRADAGVLYIARRDLADAMALLPVLHRTVSTRLADPTPMFTKRLARGLAVAEDPGDGRSFGQHRCQLVAEGLVRAFENGKTALPELTSAIAARFAEERLVITRPWLNAGSRHRYVWPTRRSQSQRSNKQ